MTTRGYITGGRLVTERAAVAAKPRGPQFFGNGITECAGCGASVSGPFDARPILDAEARRWQEYCYKNLRCENCGGAKTREWGRVFRCMNCARPEPWIEVWGVVGRQAAMDHIEQGRRERQWPMVWQTLWSMFAKDHAARTVMWNDSFVSAWKGIALVHGAWTWWSRKWFKQWGRLGAHHRRRGERFANPAAWGDEDPTVRRFSQLEFD